MKFAIAFVAFFALAHGGVIAPLPYAWNAPITQYSSYPAAQIIAAAPQVVAAPHQVIAAPAISYAHHVQAPAAVEIAPLAYHASPIAYHAAPVVQAPIVHAPVVVAKAAASYTAATRGAVHTAPLPGHDVSQTSLNLAPAPGTL